MTCQQGLQFFPDRPAALAELRRMPRPGGRLGVAVWGHHIEVQASARRLSFETVSNIGLATR